MTMGALFMLLGLVLLAVPFAVIGLIVSQLTLTRRLGLLERRIEDLIAASEDPKSQAPAPQQDRSRPHDSADAVAARGPLQTSGEMVQQPVMPPPNGPGPSALPVPPNVADRLIDWLRENWFYAVSALSLALAGLFLVQYGVENGLLPPAMRVAAALMLGAALISGGEAIRKRYGDGEGQATAYLPSVFSGSGLVTVFSGIVAARRLYDLIAPEIAFVALVAVAIGAVGLGWLHGPLLAAIGVIGATLAPFAVGGSADELRWLFGYFLLITMLGLSVDAVRRWGWISVLTLVLAYGAGFALGAAPGTEPYFVGYMVGLALLAVMVPGWRFWPAHDGPMVSMWLTFRAGRPFVATLIAAGGIAASTALIVTHIQGGQALPFWVAVTGLTVLAVVLITWAHDARAVQDLVAIPVIGLGLISVHWVFNHGAVQSFAAQRPPETAMPIDASILIAIGAVLSGLAAWRSFSATQFGAIWAGAAALIAPVMAVILEISWHPSGVIGSYPWALHIAALALMQVVLAERFARVDGADSRLRLSLAVLSALLLTAFFCLLVLSSAALTVALTVTVLAAALLDRRFDLPVMGVFLALGVMAIGWRVLINPGLSWAHAAPLVSVVLAYGGALTGFFAAYLALRRQKGRGQALIWLESAAWSTAAVLVSVLLYRAIAASVQGLVIDSHWALGLGAVVWFATALAQLQRAIALKQLRDIRFLLAGLFGMIGAGAMLRALTLANPLVSTVDRAEVSGPILLNTLAVAYLLPSIVIWFGVTRIALQKSIRRLGLSVAAALAAVWAFTAIRHFWRGAAQMHLDWSFTQPELYSYTVVLLILGATLFVRSITRRSELMRKAGLVGIGLAVTKVFIVDISGLDGLMRVVSLLGLGLVLAGLAWLNRWAQGKADAAR